MEVGFFIVYSFLSYIILWFWNAISVWLCVYFCVSMKKILDRKAIRLQWYNYGSEWAYFITICTKNRTHYFGDIVNGVMMVNDLGKHTYHCRQQIQTFHPHVIVKEYVCMPNHIHGIITVGTHYMRPIIRHNKNIHSRNDCNPVDGCDPMDGCNPSLQCTSESLGSIVRGFKIGVTQYAYQHAIPFQRQSRFHDHIIRDQLSYERITQYIQNNPKNWKEDRFWKPMVVNES